MRMISLLLLWLTFSQVNAIADSKDKKEPKAPDVVFVDEDDKELKESMTKAQKSLSEFIKAFEKQTKEQDSFAIKIAIKDGKEVEHFWVAVSKFDGKEFEGFIGNEPALVKTVKEGEKIKVSKDKVEDWMYVDQKKLIGGYSVRVLRNRLTPAERKELDNAVPYKIE